MTRVIGMVISYPLCTTEDHSDLVNLHSVKYGFSPQLKTDMTL